LKQEGDFFATGVMVVTLKHKGTTAWLREMLKISVRTSVSSAAQSLTHDQECCQAHSQLNSAVIKCPIMFQTTSRIISETEMLFLLWVYHKVSSFFYFLLFTHALSSTG